MSTLITILHVVVCLFLMLTVLLQQGKGGGMGGAFGGSSAGTVFGGAGASSFLRRLTAAAATVFMITSMVLAYVASRDAGEPLERYSRAEAARLKQKKQAEKRGLESALDGGVAPGSGSGAPLQLDMGNGSEPLSIDPSGGVVPGPTGASGAGGAMVPAEAPAPTTPTPAPAAPHAAVPHAAAPPAGHQPPSAPTPVTGAGAAHP